MLLVNGRTLLDCIQEKRILAGAFNITNLETTISVLSAIGRSELPNLIQIAPANVQLPGYDYIYEITKRHADKMDAPVNLHLDHGKTQEDVKRMVRTGLTSVIIDGVTFSSRENIAFTQETIDFCRSYGVPVEVGLRAILGREDDHVSEVDCKTEPEKVKIFVEHTGCDILAVSIGSIHGLGDVPRIDIPLLKRIAKVSPALLVVHGDSDIAPEILRSFINYRVAKVNIVSGLCKVSIVVIGKMHVNNHSEANLARVMISTENAVEEDVYSKVLMINEKHRSGK